MKKMEEDKKKKQEELKRLKKNHYTLTGHMSDLFINCSKYNFIKFVF